MHRDPIVSQDQSAAIVALLQETAQAEGPHERQFILLNRSRDVWPYQIAALWDGAKVAAHSGAGQIDRHGPYGQWLSALFKHLHERPDGPLTAADLPATLAETWHEWWPEHALLVRSAASADAGMWLLVRDVPWLQQELVDLSRWHALWHVQHCDRSAAQAARASWSWQSMQAWWRRAGQQDRLRRIGLAAAMLLGAALIPVHLTVRAPAELVARDPMVLRAAVDGTVRMLKVQSNQVVKAGQVLAELDDAGWASRLHVAQQSLLTAEVEWRQVSQQALNDPKAKALLASAQGKYEERKAEVSYLEQQVQRTAIMAPRDGVVLIQDAGSWPGRTVVAGEAIMKLAQPADQEVEAWLPVGDAINLPIGATMHLHLSSHPSSPLSAKLRTYSYEAEHRPELGWGYRLRGTLDAGQSDRLGARGTVRIDGAWVPVCYWVLRRPLAALREATGW